MGYGKPCYFWTGLLQQNPLCCPADLTCHWVTLASLKSKEAWDIWSRANCATRSLEHRKADFIQDLCDRQRDQGIGEVGINSKYNRKNENFQPSCE
jgi:hypothetical protein